MNYIVVVDVGTSGMMAALYCESGKIRYSVTYEYSTEFIYPAMVEQDPLIWRTALMETLRKVSDYAESMSIIPAGVAVTSQRASVIPVDRQGNPLHKAIMWQDKRTINECNELLESYSMKDIYLKTGLRVNPYFVLPRIMWLKGHRPEIFKDAYKLIGVQDYVTYCLTGRFVTDHSQAARTMLMNIHNFDWDKDMLETAGLTTDKLCELVPPGSVAGFLTDEAAKATGLKKGTPVVISGGDQQNAAVALNVFKQGMAEVNSGTGSFVIAHTDTPAFDPEVRVICSASAIAGKWILETSIFNTGSMYRWCRNQFYRGEEGEYELMNEEAVISGPGAGGVQVFPHFEGSAAPYWEPRAKGIIFNLSLGTKRGDIARAMLEGIAMEVAMNIALLESQTGKIGCLSIAGGLAKSALFAEIQANAVDEKVVRYFNSEATSLGSAMIAAVSLGLYPDIGSSFEGMRDAGSQTFTPQPEEVALYKRLMAKRGKLFRVLQAGEVYKEFMEI